MIYVMIAAGFEETEALAAVDILRRGELPVQMVGVGGRTVTGAHGITVVCDIADEQAEPEKLTMLVLPGGMPGTLNLERSEIVQGLIDLAFSRGIWIGAICAAPSILGHKGLLIGRKAVCYSGFEDQLTGAQVLDCPVAVDGSIITGNGMGNVFAFALKLVECLLSKERADLLSAAMMIDEK